MAYSARIDELEKKFSENARRYFAPLANEYRKAGDLDRAIEICRAHLPQQPGHMSGHIVYGQALYESRQLDEAKTVFEAALALDPENLIALRHLGDIARDSGDPLTARSWYMRVLDADPRNDDVAAMLAELDAAAAAAPAESAPAPSDGASGWGDINPERAGDESSGAAADAGRAEDDLEVVPEPDQSSTIGLEPMPSDASVDEVLGTEAGSSPPSRSREADAGPGRAGRDQPSLDTVLNEAFAPDADTQEMEAAGSVSSAAFASPKAPDGAIAPAGKDADAGGETGGALGEGALAEVDALFDEIASEGTNPAGTRAVDAKSVDRSESRSGAGQTASKSAPSKPEPAATGDALFGDSAGDDAEAGDPSPAERPDGLETSEFIAPSRDTAQPKPARGTGSMAVTGLTTFEQPTEEDSSARAAFVTETMAELYLQQGFAAEALDIYRKLLEQNPEDSSLRDRIEQLERGGQTSLSVAAVSSEVIQAAQQRHAARPVRTARSFFGRLAGHHLGQPLDQPEEPIDHPAAAPPNDPTDEPVWEVRDTRGDEPRSPSAAPRSATPAESQSGGRRPTGSGIPIVSDLFGDMTVSEADEAAASMLASAFSTSFGADVGTQPPAPTQATTSGGSGGKAGGTAGRPARAAGRELSLDQVFRDSENRQPRKSGPFSFDQFFSDGTQGGSAEAPTPEEPRNGEEPHDPEGDLEQFTAWLEGLKRK